MLIEELGKTKIRLKFLKFPNPTFGLLSRLASSILEGLESWFAIFETKGISIRGSNIWSNMIGRHFDS